MGSWVNWIKASLGVVISLLGVVLSAVGLVEQGPNAVAIIVMFAFVCLLFLIGFGAFRRIFPPKGGKDQFLTRECAKDMLAVAVSPERYPVCVMSSASHACGAAGIA